jgi:hypothetical protein
MPISHDVGQARFKALRPRLRSPQALLGAPGPTSLRRFDESTMILRAVRPRYRYV